MGTIYYAVIFFIFGLVFGSFYNVLGYRLPNNMSILYPSSHCPSCKHKLNSLDLIPVFSYIFMGGKCRYCKKKISIFYPIIEIITGLIFLISYLKFGMTIDTFIAIIFSSMIIIVILSDILYMIIPDSVLLVSLISLITLLLIKSGIANVVPMLLDIFIPFIFMLLLKFIGNKMFKRESLGDGDIKLMAIVGLVLGWEIAIFVLVLASFLGLPISIYTLIKKSNHELPFAPYLGISAILCLYLSVNINMILKFLGI